ATSEPRLGRPAPERAHAPVRLSRGQLVRAIVYRDVVPPHLDDSITTPPAPPPPAPRAAGGAREREPHADPLVDADVQLLQLLEWPEDPFVLAVVDPRPLVRHPDLDRSRAGRDRDLHPGLRARETERVVDELLQDSTGDAAVQVRGRIGRRHVRI